MMVTNDADSVIAEKMDLLFEKRKAVRELALGTLNKTFSQNVCGSSLETRVETLAEGLERVLRDQQQEPMLLAMRTAALASISLPSGHMGFFNKLYDPFKRLILSATQSANVKSDAVNALAMICFMSSLFDVDHEMATTCEVLNFFRDLLFNKSIYSDIAGPLLSGWMLLASTLPVSTVHEECYLKDFTKLSGFLGEDCDVLVRVAASRAIAVLLELERDFHKSEDAPATVVPDTTEILEQMYTTFDDKGKFKGKADLKKQRGILKSSMEYVENGTTEEDTILIRNFPLVVGTQVQRFRMGCFREFLGEGFMAHLEENKNLMYLFDYYVDTQAPPPPSMSKNQRRLSLSEISKANTKARSGLRAIREHEVGYSTE